MLISIFDNFLILNYVAADAKLKLKLNKQTVEFYLNIEYKQNKVKLFLCLADTWVICNFKRDFLNYFC